jgi:hypothetical protein
LCSEWGIATVILKPAQKCPGGLETRTRPRMPTSQRELGGNGTSDDSGWQAVTSSKMGTPRKCDLILNSHQLRAMQQIYFHPFRSPRKHLTLTTSAKLLKLVFMYTWPSARQKLQQPGPNTRAGPNATLERHLRSPAASDWTFHVAETEDDGRSAWKILVPDRFTQCSASTGVVKPEVLLLRGTEKGNVWASKQSSWDSGSVCDMELVHVC